MGSLNLDYFFFGGRPLPFSLRLLAVNMVRLLRGRPGFRPRGRPLRRTGRTMESVGTAKYPILARTLFMASIRPFCLTSNARFSARTA